MTLSHPRIERRTAVGSTNDEALALLQDGDDAVWVTADEQLSGRGRRQREWTSKPGNLYASVAFNTALSGEAFGALPLAAAVALGDAVAALGAEPQLKWPNDVLIERRKLAGILLEAQSVSHRRRVVIGFGVNVAHHPGDAAQACHLNEFIAVSVPAVFDALRPALADVVATLNGADGQRTIRDRWLERAVGLGEAIDVRLPAETRHGVFRGLDPFGRLILDEGGAVSSIAAGDVFIRQGSENERRGI